MLGVIEPACAPAIARAVCKAMGSDSVTSAPADPYLTLNPSFFFNGVDFAVGTFSGGPNTARQYNGVYATGPANVMAVQGGRLDGSVWVGTDAGGTPVVSRSVVNIDTYTSDFSSVQSTAPADKYTLSNPLATPGALVEPARTNAVYPSNGTCMSYHSPAVTIVDGVDDMFGGTSARRFVFPAGASGADPWGSAYRALTRVSGQVGTLHVFLRGDAGSQCYVYLSTSATASGDRSLVTCTGGWGEVVISNTAASTSAFIIISTSSYTGIGTGAPLPAATIDVCHVEFNAAVAVASSPIITTTAAVTRPATRLTYPSSGKIRANNFAIRVVFAPTADNIGVGAAPNIWLTQIGGSDYTALYCNGTNVSMRKVVGGVTVAVAICNSGSNIAKGVVYDVFFVQTADYGFVGCSRMFLQGGWSAWTAGTAVTTASGKQDCPIATTQIIGSGTTAEIKQIDYRLLPLGLSDPIAYAKQLYGV